MRGRPARRRDRPGYSVSPPSRALPTDQRRGRSLGLSGRCPARRPASVGVGPLASAAWLGDAAAARRAAGPAATVKEPAMNIDRFGTLLRSFRTRPPVALSWGAGRRDRRRHHRRRRHPRALANNPSANGNSAISAGGTASDAVRHRQTLLRRTLRRCPGRGGPLRPVRERLRPWPRVRGRKLLCGGEPLHLHGAGGACGSPPTDWPGRRRVATFRVCAGGAC